MSRVSLGMVTIVVPDIEDGISHYTRDWGFALEADTTHSSGHRWVEINPGGGARMRLIEATNDAHHSVIGRQAGGRVAFFLYVDDFSKMIGSWADAGIEIEEPPRHEPYGMVAVLKDKFGNRFDIIEAEEAEKE